MAHDFNNLLLPILGNALAGREALPEEGPLRTRFERIHHAARYAAELVQQMLTYAGRGSFTAEPLDLSALVGGMEPLLRSLIPARARLAVALAPDLPPVGADATQLRQVVMNLVTNAAEALPETGGCVTVRTGRAGSDRRLLERAFPDGAPQEARHLVLEVRDDGGGMDAETRARVFEPFFSTKLSGRGMGLAAVHGIVQRHGGRVVLDSEPGRGTRFRILLPESAPAATLGEEEARTASSPAGATSRSAHVLVVDDDEAVAEVAGEFLGRAGHRVTMAAGGREALALFDAAAKSTDPVDAVVLDWVMPDLDGPAVIDALRQRRSDLPVVITSGFDERAAGPPAKGPLGFVQKPYAPEALNRAVAELLEGSQGAPPAQSGIGTGR